MARATLFKLEICSESPFYRLHQCNFDQVLNLLNKGGTRAKAPNLSVDKNLSNREIIF